MPYNTKEVLTMNKLSLGFVLLIVSLTDCRVFGQQEGLTLVISIQQSRHLLVEPLIVAVSLENRSTQKRFIPAGIDEYNLSFSITLPNGEQARYIGERINLGFPIIMAPLEPGAALRTEVNLLDRYSKLDQPGRYTVTATLSTRWYQVKSPPEIFSGKLQSNPVIFEIVEPSGVDLEAFHLIQALKAKKYEQAKQASPADRESLRRSFRFLFVLHPDLCQRIIEDFPTSVYAKYAYFYLAERDRTLYIEMQRGDDLVDKTIEYYRKAMSDAPQFVLSGRAHWGIARCYFLKKDYSAAKRGAEKVIKDYPDSFAAQEAKKLEDEIGKKQGQIEEANTSPGK